MYQFFSQLLLKRSLLVLGTVLVLSVLATTGGCGLISPAPSSAGPSASTSANTCTTDLKSELQRLRVPGLAAGIVKNGRLVCTAVAGMANIEQNRPVTPDTLFMLASISKTFTATALMQLYDQGKFKLDDDINKYLPFQVHIPAYPTTPITFRQLLTHTSSIQDNPNIINCPGSCSYGSSLIPFVTKGGDSPIPLGDFVRGYLTPGGAYYDRKANFLSRRPGTASHYSNMGVVLAAYLVETISDTPFDQFCRDHIFTPLSMSKTSWKLAGIDQSLLAMPYDFSSSTGYKPFGQFGEPDWPDGSLRTSVNELAHILIMYMQGGQYNGQQILKSTTVQEMLKNQAPLDPNQGLIWFYTTFGNSRRVVGHDGGDHGVSTNMFFDPAKGEGVILLSNGMWRSSADALMKKLFQEAKGY